MRLLPLLFVVGLTMSLPAQTQSTLALLFATKSATAPSLQYVNLKLMEGPGSRPATDKASGFAREATARKNQYDVVRSHYDPATKAGAYQSVWLREGVVRTQANYDQPSRPLGYQRLDVSKKGGEPTVPVAPRAPAVPTTRSPAETFSAATFEARFPNAPIERMAESTRPAAERYAREKPVVRASEVSPSVRVLQENLRQCERNIRRYEQRIERNKQWASEREFHRRLEQISRRFERRVNEQLAEHRRAGRLERLTRDSSGHLVNPYTRERAGVNDLPRGDRKRLEAERDGARKRAWDALKDSARHRGNLEKKKTVEEKTRAKLQKQITKEKAKPKKPTTKGGKK